MSKEKIDLRHHQNSPEFKQEEIQRREAHLLQIGFKPETVEEWKKNQPELVDPVQVDSVMDTLQTLVYNGKSFSDPKKLVESSPMLLHSDSSKFADNLHNLEQLGFTDPIALVTKKPQLLNSNPETLKHKLIELKKMGFTDPTALVEKYPPVWFSKSQSLRHRVRVLGKILRLY